MARKPAPGYLAKRHTLRAAPRWSSLWPAAQLEKRQQALSATVLIALPFSLEAWRQLEYAHNLIGTTL